MKGANCWDAIDTPRFNGCIKSGTHAATADSLSSLDAMPFLFFVMWDVSEDTRQKRCRVWVVRTKTDIEFRRLALSWYEKRENGQILSNNFQLHPPRNKDNNIFKNSCGNLRYPLLFEARLEDRSYAVWKPVHSEQSLNRVVGESSEFSLKYFNEGILSYGTCLPCQ